VEETYAQCTGLSDWKSMQKQACCYGEEIKTVMLVNQDANSTGCLETRTFKNQNSRRSGQKKDTNEEERHSQRKVFSNT